MNYYRYIIIYILYEACRGAGAQSVTVESTGCGFGPHSRKRSIDLHYIFSFLRSGVEAERKGLMAFVMVEGSDSHTHTYTLYLLTMYGAEFHYYLNLFINNNN